MRVRLWLRGRELITRFGLSDLMIWNREEGRKAREGKGEGVISHQGMTQYSQRGRRDRSATSL